MPIGGDRAIGLRPSLDVVLTPGDEEEEAREEEVLFSRLREIDQTWQATYGEAGIICETVFYRRLWRYRTDPATGQKCKSFSRWVAMAAPWSRSKIYEARRLVSDLRHDVPEDKLKLIRRNTLLALRSLPVTIRRDPKVIDYACTYPPKQFLAKVHQDYPGLSRKVMRPYIFRVMMDADRRMAIEDAIHRAIEAGHALDKESALEHIVMSGVEAIRETKVRRSRAGRPRKLAGFVVVPIQEEACPG